MAVDERHHGITRMHRSPAGANKCIAIVLAKEIKVKRAPVSELRFTYRRLSLPSVARFASAVAEHVYDVTRRDTFTNLSDVWAKELELNSSNLGCIKMLVGNKVDREAERVVSREEGLTLAKELGCLFLECSAKTRTNVEQCFEELALKLKKLHCSYGIHCKERLE